MMAKKILVLGGAGYIGSHMVRYLRNHGEIPIIFDNLSTGHLAAIGDEKFYQGDIRNPDALEKVFVNECIAGVMHFCAKSLVGESMEHPDLYFDNNVVGGLSVLNMMRKYDVRSLIFSSTAATYGQPVHLPIKETDPQVPTNPYGETKLTFEKILKWYDHAYGIKSIALRYFNAAGADLSAQIGEDHFPETHLIPIVLQVAMGIREHVTIYGSDWATKDGTCIRDYIHVMDLAQAHLLALHALFDGHETDVYNLGTGIGYTVREIIQHAEQVTKKIIPIMEGARRSGDPQTLVASSEKIQCDLKWNPQYALDDIVKTAWAWHQAYPKGYT